MLSVAESCQVERVILNVPSFGQLSGTNEAVVMSSVPCMDQLESLFEIHYSKVRFATSTQRWY